MRKWGDLKKWWGNPRIPLSPVTRLRLAWIVVVISMVGWPLSAVTWAAQEPQFVLGLSWLALTITALDVLATSDVSAEQDEESGPSEEEAELGKTAQRARDIGC